MLRIYRTVVELVRLLASVFIKVAQHDADLARQARRASASIALNCGAPRAAERRAQPDTRSGRVWGGAPRKKAEPQGVKRLADRVRRRGDHTWVGEPRTL